MFSGHISCCLLDCEDDDHSQILQQCEEYSCISAWHIVETWAHLYFDLFLFLTQFTLNSEDFGIRWYATFVLEMHLRNAAPFMCCKRSCIEVLRYIKC